MKNQKGSSTFITILLIALVIVGGYIFFQKEMSKPSMPSQTQNSIQSGSELSGLSTELDSVNVDSMDTELNQNDQDVSSF